MATIPDLIRLLAEAPPESRVLPDPAELMAGISFLEQTTGASSAASRTVAAADANRRRDTAGPSASVLRKEDSVSPAATALYRDSAVGQKAYPVGPASAGGRAASIHDIEPAVFDPARPTVAVNAHGEVAQPGVFDQHAGPTVEVLRPDRALSELARPVSPTPHMQPEAFVSTPERAYGNTARLTTPAAGVGDSAKIVTPEYAAGVLASAAIPHFVVGGKASPQSPYFSSGVQVTPTTRVDFVIPHALPFDAKAMFDAADALTAKRAPRVVEGGGVQDAFTPQPQADVQSTAEMVATHYTAHQQSALDRRY